MNITLANVISLNGNITNGDNPDVTQWASAEDGRHFRQLIQEHDAIVMGRATYEAVRPQPEAGRLRVVMTHEPGNYQALVQPEMLEFTGSQPADIAADLENRGYEHVLIAGGSTVNGAFVAAGLVNDAYITIEPKLFGSGTPLLAEGDFAVDCTLIDVTQLNAAGTLLAHYALR